MIYEIHKNRLHILNFATCEKHRRQGVGRAMVDRLRSKLSHDRRNRILLEVRETNLSAQLFFRSVGFRATATLHGYFSDGTEDAYVMQYRYVPAADEVQLTHERSLRW
jgi:ribosomal-protein-alanine N-acetyltransferase